jgi:hypothetical protein
MFLRKLVLVALLVVGSASQARADVALGAFIGEPTGLDLKLGLAPNSALDILFGWYSHWNDRDRIDDGTYAHVTYLVTPMRSTGRSVIVPLRLGIGAAIFDDSGRFDDDLNVAVRVPFEVALVFTGTPLELYFEVALKMTIVDGDDDHDLVDLDGGLGLRFYF